MTYDAELVEYVTMQILPFIWFFNGSWLVVLKFLETREYFITCSIRAYHVVTIIYIIVSLTIFHKLLNVKVSWESCRKYFTQIFFIYKRNSLLFDTDKTEM